MTQLLMACCNHKQQLADESHMKMTAAKSNKQRLIERGLLAAKDRYSPKNGPGSRTCTG